MAKKRSAWELAGGDDRLWDYLTDAEKEFLSNIDEHIGAHIVRLISRVAASFEMMDYDDAFIIKNQTINAICGMAVERALKRKHDKWIDKNLKKE